VNCTYCTDWDYREIAPGWSATGKLAEMVGNLRASEEIAASLLRKARSRELMLCRSIATFTTGALGADRQRRASHRFFANNPAIRRTFHPDHLTIQLWHKP
jgi:hypothetical protein